MWNNFLCIGLGIVINRVVIFLIYFIIIKMYLVIKLMVLFVICLMYIYESGLMKNDF